MQLFGISANKIQKPSTGIKEVRNVLLLVLPWMAYIVTYLGRANYSACLVEICNETGISRSLAGSVSSSFCLCYVIGQLFAGTMVKKHSPVKLIGGALFTVAVLNVVFPFSGNTGMMIALWGINGVAQSVMMCGATQIYVTYLHEPWLSRGAVLLNTIGAVGGVINYLLTWAVLSSSGWQTMFYLAGAILIVYGIAWFIIMLRVTRSGSNSGQADIRQSEEEHQDQRGIGFRKGIRCFGTVFALFGCLTIGVLREGIVIWIPSYYNEVFRISASVSTAMTSFVPLFQLVGAFSAGAICRKVKNIHWIVACAFVISAVSMFLLWISGSASLAAAIILFVLNAISMTAALTFYVTLFPVRYFTKADTSVMVGALNLCAHVGTLAASSGIGWLSEKSGWNMTVLVLAVLAAVSCVLSVLGALFAKEDIRKKEKENAI